MTWQTEILRETVGEEKRFRLFYIKPLQFRFGNDDFIFLVSDIDGMAGFKAAILQPFAAKLNNGEKCAGAILAVEAFIAYG